MGAERDSKKPETTGRRQPADRSNLDERRESEAERERRIAIGAYYNAEHRGFEEGGELDDWLQAERDYEKSLRGGKAVGSRSSPARPEGEGEIIEPDQVGQWAERLNVSASRLRAAIRNVGARLPDVKQFLSRRRGHTGL